MVSAVAAVRERGLSPDERERERPEQHQQGRAMLHVSSSWLTPATLGATAALRAYDFRNSAAPI
jgi:hypothetical protein